MSVLTASVRLSGVQRHVCGRVGLSGRVGVSAGAWACLRARGGVCEGVGLSVGVWVCLRVRSCVRARRGVCRGTVWGTQVICLGWNHLISSIGCLRTMCLHRAHSFFRPSSPWHKGR